MMMRSAVVVVAFVLCVSSVRAFFAPLGRPCAGVRHRSVGLSRSTTSAPRLSMSSVALPPPSPTTHEHQRSNIQRVKANDDFLSALAEHQDKLVVIKFYDRFCRACDEIRHRFEDLSGSAGVDQAAFYEIEFSDSKELCKQLGIKRLPTVHMYAGADGRVVDLPAGPSRFNQVEEKFSDVLATMARDEAKDEFRRKGGDE